MYWVETSWLFLIRLEGLIKGFQLKKIPSSTLIFDGRIQLNVKKQWRQTGEDVREVHAL